MQDVVFKVPMEGFQFLRKDALNYYKIPLGEERIVPDTTEMFVTDSIEIIGDLTIQGRVTIWSMEDIRSKNLVTITADHTQTIGDEIIVIDAGANDVELTLLEASNFEIGSEVKIIVKDEGTFSVTLTAGGSDTISGDASVLLYKYEVLELNTISTTEWIG